MCHGVSTEDSLAIPKEKIQAKVQDKLENMMVGESEMHLLNDNIIEISVNYQLVWLRTVHAEKRNMPAS